MEQEKYSSMVGSDPSLDPNYNYFFSQRNITYISQTVTQRLRNLFPKRKPVRVTDENIKGIMWEWYQYEYNNPQIMTQEIINMITNSLENELSVEDNNQTLDPWIQLHDENYGISRHDFSGIKLNNRRYQVTDFEVRR